MNRITIKSATYRALSISDAILAVIFSYVEEPSDATDCGSHTPGGGRDIASLTNVARVCKLFSDVALSILWRDLPSVLFLFKILTSLVESKSGATAVYAVLHPLSDIEWHRFEYYARKVRKSCWRFDTIIDSSVFFQIHRRSAGRSILPGLVTFRWNGDDSQLDHLPSLLSQSLGRLEADLTQSHRIRVNQVETDTNDTTLGYLFSSLKLSSPFLHEARLHFGSYSLCVPSLAGFTRLRILQITLTDGPIVDALHSCAFLEDLLDFSMSMCHQVLGNEASEIIAGTSGFRKLQRLALVGPTDLVNAILQCISSPHLSSVAIEYSYWGNQHEEDIKVHRRILSLFGTKFHLSLRILNIHYSSIYFEPDNTPSLESFLSPLSAIQGLERLTIDLRQVISCGAETINLIATTWPRIQYLYLESFPPEQDEDVPTPSISTLVDFTRHCPDLRYLHLTGPYFQPPLSGSTQEHTSDLHFPNMSHAVQTLYIDIDPDQSLASRLEIAKYIDGIFPHLRFHGANEEELSMEKDHQSNEGWRSVELMVLALQSGRRTQAQCEEDEPQRTYPDDDTELEDFESEEGWLGLQYD